ncbi:MAG: BrnT family toxin [Gammaproteobacteria bacterium]
MYNISRHFEWDEAKRDSNQVSRGFDFGNAADFDWDSAYIYEDLRKDYGETRYTAVGYYMNRLTILVFTPRAGATRIISWRKANPREITRYGKKVDR